MNVTVTTKCEMWQSQAERFSSGFNAACKPHLLTIATAVPSAKIVTADTLSRINMEPFKKGPGGHLTISASVMSSPLHYLTRFPKLACSNTAPYRLRGMLATYLFGFSNPTTGMPSDFCRRAFCRVSRNSKLGST